MEFESITFNLVNSAIRHETLDGKEYVVAPVAMLTVGVHNGSGGPLLYDEDQLKKHPSVWNMKPVVVYHPTKNGASVTACSKEVLESQAVGFLMNSFFNGKLRSEVWIDTTKADKVDKRVIEALEKNQKMEVSTGLFVDRVGDVGEWEGKSYTAKAINFRPDHLALLPDKVGACSIADGAGLLQLNEQAEVAGIELDRLMQTSFENARRIIGNALSHGSIRKVLDVAGKEKYGDNAFVFDVFSDFVIYEQDGKLWKTNYEMDNDTPKLIGKWKRVQQITEFRSMDGKPTSNQLLKDKESIPMTKQETINTLIDNENSVFDEDDREFLEEQTEDKLQKFLDVNKKSSKKSPKKPFMKKGEEEEEEEEVYQKNEKVVSFLPPKQEDVAPVSLEDYLNNAPPEIRGVLESGLSSFNAKKGELVEEILGNENNRFTRDYLMAKAPEELQVLCDLAQPTKSQQVVPSYAGAAGAASQWSAPTQNEDQPACGPLVMEEMSWKTE